MSIFHAIILGLIQGITEFLPISSSGHLIFLPSLFGWVDQGIEFDAILNLGTLIAVVFYFRKELWNIAKSYFIPRSRQSEVQKKDFFLGNMLIVATLPAALVGFLWGDYLQDVFRSPFSIAITMGLWGLVLYAAQKYFEKIQRAKQLTTLEKISWKQTLFIGFAQALSLIPGTSRSGITMTAGLFSKLDKSDAAKFAFYMSVPITALAVAHKMLDVFQMGIAPEIRVPLIFGFFTSLVTAFLAIKFLLSLLKKYSFTPFVVYRLVMSIAILLYFV